MLGPMDSPPPGSPDAIVVRDLTKLFRNKPAVDHVSFRVARGTFFGFLGPNGAGKSTTIKMLTGLLRPTAGEVTIEGFRASGCRPSITAVPIFAPAATGSTLGPAGDRRARGEIRGVARVFSLPAEDRSKPSYHLRAEEGTPPPLIATRPFPRPSLPTPSRPRGHRLQRLGPEGDDVLLQRTGGRLCEGAVIDHGRIVGSGTLDEIRQQREVGRDAGGRVPQAGGSGRRPDLSWIGRSRWSACA